MHYKYFTFIAGLLAAASVLLSCGPEQGPVDTGAYGCSEEPQDAECEDDLVSIFNRDELEEFCSMDCGHVESLSLGKLEGVESVHGFSNVVHVDSNLHIATLADATTFDAFNNLVEVGQLEFIDNVQIEEFDGFESLERATEIKFQTPRGGLVEMIDPFPALEEVIIDPEEDVERIRGRLQITRQPDLERVTGFENLKQAGTVDFRKNDSLTEVEGFSNLERVAAIVIRENPELDELPEFESLTEIGKILNIQDNGNIRECRVDELLDQLEVKPDPEDIYLSGLSDEPCD